MSDETPVTDAVMLELVRREYVALGCPVIYPDNDKDPMPLEYADDACEAVAGRKEQRT